eukprot:scaffold7729_cov63-Phaeocystis_antarctica.AAC.1
MCRAWSSELASLFCMWRTASSRSFSRCADRRRRLRAAGMSGAGRRAVLLLRAEWRERGFCITACLHLNPSMALTTGLANSFRLREAARTTWAREREAEVEGRAPLAYA